MAFTGRYKTGYCITSKELFERFNKKQLKIRVDATHPKYGCDSRQELCGKVFTYFIYLVILDIIFNSTTFQIDFPTNPMRVAQLYVKKFDGERFAQMYKKGMFSGIDFVKSNHSGYQIFFQYSKKSKGGRVLREKPIYINSKLKHIFYNKINNGMQYY